MHHMVNEPVDLQGGGVDDMLPTSRQVSLDVLEFWCHTLFLDASQEETRRVNGEIAKYQLSFDGEGFDGDGDQGGPSSSLITLPVRYGRLHNRLAIASFVGYICEIPTNEGDVEGRDHKQISFLKTGTNFWEKCIKQLLILRGFMLRYDHDAPFNGKEDAKHDQDMVDLPMFDESFQDLLALFKLHRSIALFRESLVRELNKPSTEDEMKREHLDKIIETFEDSVQQHTKKDSPLLRIVRNILLQARRKESVRTLPAKLLKQLKGLLMEKDEPFSFNTLQRETRMLMREWHEQCLQLPVLVRLGYGGFGSVSQVETDDKTVSSWGSAEAEGEKLLTGNPIDPNEKVDQEELKKAAKSVPLSDSTDDYMTPDQVDNNLNAFADKDASKSGSENSNIRIVFNRDDDKVNGAAKMSGLKTIEESQLKPAPTQRQKEQGNTGTPKESDMVRENIDEKEDRILVNDDESETRVLEHMNEADETAYDSHAQEYEDDNVDNIDDDANGNEFRYGTIRARLKPKQATLKKRKKRVAYGREKAQLFSQAKHTGSKGDSHDENSETDESNGMSSSARTQGVTMKGRLDEDDCENGSATNEQSDKKKQTARQKQLSRKTKKRKLAPGTVPEKSKATKKIKNIFDDLDDDELALLSNWRSPLTKKKRKDSKAERDTPIVVETAVQEAPPIRAETSTNTGSARSAMSSGTRWAKWSEDEINALREGAELHRKASGKIDFRRIRQKYHHVLGHRSEFTLGLQCRSMQIK